MQVFWGLDKKLAQRKHFPSLNWFVLFSRTSCSLLLLLLLLFLTQQLVAHVTGVVVISTTRQHPQSLLEGSQSLCPSISP